MCKHDKPARFRRVHDATVRALKGAGVLVLFALALRFVVGVVATGSIWVPSIDLEQSAAEMAALYPNKPVVADRAAADRILRLYAAATVIAVPENATPQPNIETRLDEPEAVAQARRYIDAVQPALYLLDRAAGRSFSLFAADVPAHDPTGKNGRYGLPWNNFFGLVRQLSQAQRTRALLAIHDGGYDEAVAAVLSGLQLAEFAAVDRTLIGELIGQACIRQQVTVIEQLRPHLADLPQARLEELVVRLRAIDPVYTIGRSLAGESNFGFSVIGRMVNGTFDGDVGDMLGNASLKGVTGGVIMWFARPLLAADYRCYTRVMQNVVATVASAKTPHELSLAGRNLSHESFDIPWYCFLTSMVTPNFRKVIDKGLVTRSRVDEALIEVAVELQRRRTGSAPTTLADLSTDLVPADRRQDPATGEPYRLPPAEK